MIASAYPLAQVILAEGEGSTHGNAAGARDDTGKTPALPFPDDRPKGSTDLTDGISGDASSAPGSSSSFDPSVSASRGTGSAVLDQVLGAAALMGYDLALPPLPYDKIAPVNPLRAAILEWVATTGSIVDPVELAAELARADSLPGPLQRDLALVILSASQATILQNAALSALSPEQRQWIAAHPEAALDLASGRDTPETRALAFYAGLVDTKLSLAASLMVLQAVEATRGSLADADIGTSLGGITNGLDPVSAQILSLLAEGGSKVSDAEKIRYAARIVAATTGIDAAPAPKTTATFAEAVTALTRATGQTPDADALARVLARAELLPADLQAALAAPLVAQARAVNAADPLAFTEAGQARAIVDTLYAVADAMPTLQKYNLYWRNTPDALRTSTWDSSARLAWAAEHAALIASTRGTPADLIRAGGLLEGLDLQDAKVPAMDFVSALAALTARNDHTLTPEERDQAKQAEAALSPAVRDAATRMMSSAVESQRLIDLAFARLSADERDFIALETLDFTEILQKAAPSDAEIARLARASDIASRIDRAALIQAGIVGARGTSEARDIIAGAGAYASQSAATPVASGFGAFLARMLPWGTANAQAQVPQAQCVETPKNNVIVRTESDCANDIYLHITMPVRETGGSASQSSAGGGSLSCSTGSSFPHTLLTVSGYQGTTHAPTSYMKNTVRIEDGRCVFETVPGIVQTAPVVSLDLGGSDTYIRPVAAVAPFAPSSVSLHLEMDGNDFYGDVTSAYDIKSDIWKRLGTTAAGFPNQGSAISGVAILMDGGGNDRYEAAGWGQGYGRWGVGMLVDLAGNDGYTARNFTQGAASETMNVGLGILADFGGDDSYSAKGGQGYGLGGIFLDLSGADHYFNEAAPTGVPIFKLDVLPGGALTALNTRGDGRIWIDGPAGLNVGIAIDTESVGGGADSDGDGDSDFVEFLAGSNPNDARERAADGPAGRLNAVAADTDGDLFPDFIERALSTNPDDPTSYPVGILVGPDVNLPFFETISPGELVGGIEGTPQGSDKILDLRLPLQNAGSLDIACTSDRRPTVNLPAPDVFFTATPPANITAGGAAPGTCVLASYKTDGSGGGVAHEPGVGAEKDAKTFTFSFPLGILAIGDVIPTSYDIDYFFVVDLGGDDTFRNRAGGALPVKTAPSDPNAAATSDSHRQFLASSLVVNVDVASYASDNLENPGNSIGRDRYLIPVNSTGDYTQGGLGGILIDADGNDQYVAGNASQGAVGGLLLDMGGSDSYTARDVSQGAGMSGSSATTQTGVANGGTTPPIASGGARVVARPSAPGFLMDLGTGNDRYVAANHSQGFAYAFSRTGENGLSAVGLLLDEGGNDVYMTAAARGERTQGVGGARALGALVDRAGSDVYTAGGVVSQGSTVSATRNTNPADAGSPNPGAGVLLDLGGSDRYEYIDLGGLHSRTLVRSDNLTVNRQEVPYKTASGSTGTYYGEPGIHLDARSDDPAALLAAIGSSNGPIADANAAASFLVNIPTARLAIGGPTTTRYTSEYALVIDLGGVNSYDYNAGGFVPDVLVRGETNAAIQSGDKPLVNLYPVSLLFDAGSAGSVYNGTRPLSQGAGFFSVGILADAGGPDVFRAFPQEQFAMANGWPQNSIIPDGSIGALEWAGIEARPIQLVGRFDDRFAHEWTLRIANDDDNLYLALEGPTGSKETDRKNDVLVVDFDARRVRNGFDTATGFTGIDEVRISIDVDGKCSFEDRKSGSVLGTMSADTTSKDGKVGCRNVDGRWTFEISKPLRPSLPVDKGDMAFEYTLERGFVGNTDLGFRVSFQEKTTSEIYLFPARATATDGDFDFRKDNDLIDEMSAWAATSLANRGVQRAAAINTRVASLSQGAAVAGIGLVVAFGSVDSGALYESSERSQAYAAYGGFAMLLDLGGHDTYTGRSLIQGATDAQGVAFFIDAQGNDAYRALTRSNGYSSTSSVGFFADLDGFDNYQVDAFAARDGSLTDVFSGTGGQANLEEGAEYGVGNQRAWRQGVGGFGLDYLTDNLARRNPAVALAENPILGVSDARLAFTVLGEDGCTSTSVPMAFGKPIATGTICLTATVSIKPNAALAAVGGVMSTDSVSFLVDGQPFAAVRTHLDGTVTGTSRWQTTLNTTDLRDGIKIIAAQPIYAVKTQDRGTVFYAGDIKNTCGTCAATNLLVNNPAGIGLALGPRPRDLEVAAFSPVAQDAASRLYVNWTVTHDSGEDRLELFHGYKPSAAGHNVPCAPTAPALCNILPFYFHEKTFDTKPGDKSTPERVTEKSDKTNPGISQTLPTLSTPLVISKSDPLVVHLPGRQPIAPGGNYSTRVKIELYKDGSAYSENGQPVIIADQLFNSSQYPDAGSGLPLVQENYNTARPIVQDELDKAAKRLEGNVLYDNFATGLNFVCKKGWEGAASDTNVPFCTNFHGQVGYGALKVCDPGSQLYWQALAKDQLAPVRDQRLDQKLPACWSQYSAHNATVGAINQTVLLTPLAVGAAKDGLNTVAGSLTANPLGGLNWSELHVDFNDHPIFGSRTDAYVIPAGYGLHLQIWTTRDAVVDGTREAVGSLEELYLNTIIPGVMAPFNTSPLNQSTRQIARDAGVNVPVPDVSVRDSILDALKGGTGAIRTIDATLRNPIPISSWEYDSYSAPARLEVRTITDRTTNVTIRIEGADAANDVILFPDIYVEGDVPGTPTDATIDAHGFYRYSTSLDAAARRFTQRELTFDNSLANLADGLYRIRVSAYDPYSANYTEKADTFLLDQTPPVSLITTRAYAGAALLKGASGNVPADWTVLETGSGLKETYIFYRIGPASGDTLVGTYGGWQQADSDNLVAGIQSFPPSTTRALIPQSQTGGDVAYSFMSISRDRAGNLEGVGPGANLQDAWAAKLAKGDGVGYRRIVIDQNTPTIESASLIGGRPLNWGGIDYDFVRAGTPLTFAICAKDDATGGGLARADLTLDNLDGEKVVSRIFQATAGGAGCSPGFSRFSFSGWGAVNANKELYPDGVWSAAFDVYDHAGNLASVPVTNIILDSVAPTISPKDPIYPVGQTAVRTGDLVTVRVLSTDTFGVDNAAVIVDANALNRTGELKTRTVRVDGVLMQEASFRVDAVIGNGVHNVVVRVADNAGNVRTGTIPVVFDEKTFAFDGNVTIAEVGHNFAVLRWNTTENTTASVRYGINRLDLRQKTPTESTLSKTHEVRIEGLTPSTRYHLRAVASSAGGFALESDISELATTTALYLEPISPVAKAAVHGEVPVVFRGGLRDSTDFVKYTLEVQPREGAAWSFVTTVTRQGEDHTLVFNSSRYLDGADYRLRLTADAGHDTATASFGPFESDNAAPTITVLGPEVATNDTTPRVTLLARDRGSGFTETGARLYIDGELVPAFSNITSEGLAIEYDVPSALASGKHRFKAIVTDRAGNERIHEWDVVIDGKPPVFKIHDLTYSPGTAAAKLGGTVVLNMSFEDLSGVARVIADASALNTSATEVALTQVKGFWLATIHVASREDSAVKRVQVVAEDRAGNVGVGAIDIPVDNRAPDAEAELTTVSFTKAALRVRASEPVRLVGTADASASPQAAALTEVLAVDGILTFEGLLPSRTYTYSVRAIDAAGNTYEITGRFQTSADTIAPKAVEDLAVVDLLNGTLRITWPATTDDIGIAAYRVYRSTDGASFDLVAEVRGLTYDDGGLAYEKAYTYKVVALDHGGNEGEPSPALRATATAVPRLSAGVVSPSVGSTATVFRYTISYASPGGRAPASVRIILDGAPHEMTRVDGGDAKTGITYAYETRLAPHKRDEPHTYTFEATDGRYTVRFPADGSSLRGPLVSGDIAAGEGSASGIASFAQRVPIGGTAFATIALVAASLIATSLARKKKEGSK